MYNLITILGPTATGKTKLASQLGKSISGEIISADSRQVYRGMDIGTGKDLDDYDVDGEPVPHYLVDIVDPGSVYNVFEFRKDFSVAFRKISDKGKMPILCGGTGLYLDAVLREYKMPEVPVNGELRKELDKMPLKDLAKKLKDYGNLHNTTDVTDRRRAVRAIEIADYRKKYPETTEHSQKFNSINFGIRFERSVIRERITRRLKARLEQGMINEVKELLRKGLKPEQLTYYGLEYRYVTLYVTGELTFDEMFGLLNTAIHQFAKRQMTWFRRMEKNGIRIHWINGELTMEEKISEVLGILDSESPEE